MSCVGHWTPSAPRLTGVMSTVAQPVAADGPLRGPRLNPTVGMRKR